VINKICQEGSHVQIKQKPKTKTESPFTMDWRRGTEIFWKENNPESWQISPGFNPPQIHSGAGCYSQWASICSSVTRDGRHGAT